MSGFDSLRRSWGSAIGALATVFVVLGASYASAQQPPTTGATPYVRPVPSRGETVTSRKRPQYDPVGIRVGSFFVYPSFEFTELFDSNIFATSTNAKTDFVAILSPEIAVRSNWRRHELNFGARGDIGRYKSHQKENYEDFSTVINGRYDISRSTIVFAGFRFAQRHEDRGSPDDVGGKVPTTFLATELAGGAQHIFGRFTVRFDGTIRLLDFRDVAAAGPVELIDNDDRDRREHTGVLRLTYRVNPRLAVFAQGTGVYVRYNEQLDNAGLRRSNVGFAVVGGVVFELTGKLVIEAFAGFSRRTYESSLLSTVSGPSGGLSLTWTPTGLTTVKLAVARSIEQTTLIGASGFFATQARASIDHELRRNIILNGFGSFQNDDYEGTSRNDNYIRAGLGATVLINRNLNMYGGYEFTRRISNVTGSGFVRHLVIFKIKGQI